MLAWALTDNPARRFYEALGGVEVRRKMQRIGGATLEEVAYGWPHIRALAPARPSHGGTGEGCIS
jgi:hypothetical protein